MIPRVLTVAGSDSGGGAGIQADIKTITSMRGFATSVIVALTAQNSQEVLGIRPLDTDFIEKQMDAVLSDIGTDSAKTGMLYSSEIIRSVTKKFREYDVTNIVVDPVMISKSGAELLKGEAVNELVNGLGRISELLTPNIPEAEKISGISIKDKDDMIQVAENIRDLTGASILVKGGHSADPESTDILCTDSGITEIKGKRVFTKNTHGTGDTYSSAIATNLAYGLDLVTSVRRARAYLQVAIENSFPMGKGYGALCHFCNSRQVSDEGLQQI
ncbi:MAG: bifunctional hydroxymethylpyrimidine kinase/phosphomethylpyrimidine kinase [Candidatus Thermoplasmatota archaeon]|nr:bifunctional hydroxymethylpyrimidine kinase/phosphomethylpyrimidine kinase [Candidatus Thermoplasmatota archaeon]MCL5790837.1 bifunctional hydroxymethylpyrimidine kinase/phosphomethylpyrimidine kinase [Candidatus Thermoplasmatota archaeon]